GATATRPLATTGVAAARARTVAAMVATAVAAATTSGLPPAVGWPRPGCAPSPSGPIARARLDHSTPIHGSPGHRLVAAARHRSHFAWRPLPGSIERWSTWGRPDHDWRTTPVRTPQREPRPEPRSRPGAPHRARRSPHRRAATETLPRQPWTALA